MSDDLKKELLKGLDILCDYYTYHFHTSVIKPGLCHCISQLSKEGCINNEQESYLNWVIRAEGETLGVDPWIDHLWPIRVMQHRVDFINREKLKLTKL